METKFRYMHIFRNALCNYFETHFVQIKLSYNFRRLKKTESKFILLYI